MPLDQPLFPVGTALLVDDNERYRSMLARYMKSLGFHCLEAGGGEEALATLAANPDIAMCDIKMPGIDGVTLLEHIRERWPNVAVMMITGVSDLDVARRCLALGAMDYVEKPFHMDAIKSRVSRVLERRRIRMETEKLSKPSTQ